MQGSIFKRVQHVCIKGTPRWVRLPNRKPGAFPCPVCGANLTKEKKTRYDCFWRTNGKLRSKTVATKHAATRFLTTVVAETHNGTYQQTKPVTMNVVFDEWEKHLDVRIQQRGLKPSTRKAYLSMLRKHLRPAFGACRSDRLSEQIVLEWERRCAALLAAGSMSARHYNNILITFRVLLKWARQRGQKFLSHDPLTDMKPVPVERKERRFLEPEEITRLLSAPNNDRDVTMLFLFVYSGLRRGELFGLRWSDLDEHTNRLQVRRGFSNGVIARPKTPHSRRTVDLPEALVDRLRAYRETDSPQASKGYIFHTKEGHPLNPDDWYKRVFVPTAERAGLRAVDEEGDGPNVGIHTLRHSYASLLINQGESIKYVSRQLGHTDIKITANTYGHIFKETSRSAMERLNQRVHGVSPGTR